MMPKPITRRVRLSRVADDGHDDWAIGTNGQGSGKFQVRRLNPNAKYYLREISAPSGYTTNTNIYEIRTGTGNQTESDIDNVVDAVVNQAPRSQQHMIRTETLPLIRCCGLRTPISMVHASSTLKSGTACVGRRSTAPRATHFRVLRGHCKSLMSPTSNMRR